ncbi:GNAT family N-acetyltransferase [Stenotrophomonas maltophilia]|uniref:GNAT family N-acetyltransferase n=1 Tax=Stenotrophomonas maltophilia TaxID=40324 RepID=UPI0015DDB90A|nr:GNAT family N-acetyltransferase [Stenotrophomonas maltophilia]
MTVNATLAFPLQRAAWLPAAGEGLPAGISVREAQDGDLPFLQQLYAESRAAELANVPWPDALRQAFLDNQFALQHLHYTRHYQPAHYLLVEQCGKPIGRLYLHCDEHEATLIDIALLDAVRGRGIGSALVRWVQCMARAVQLHSVVLHVAWENLAARRLYERLAFRTEGDTGSHLRMRWVATAVS